MDKVEIDTEKGVFRVNGADIKRASACTINLIGGKRTQVLIAINGADIIYNGSADVKNRPPETEERLYFNVESETKTQ